MSGVDSSNGPQRLESHSHNGVLALDEGCDEVQPASMVSTVVEFPSCSSMCEIAGILSPSDPVQEEKQLMENTTYLVYGHKVESGLDWKSASAADFVGQLQDISIPNNVHKLCDRCFWKCESLLRVTFGASSSLELIGVSCFEGTGVEEVSIPDGVRELGDFCFKGCTSFRRLAFGPSSSLERIGVACFEDTLLEEVSIPDGVPELCDRCFCKCQSLLRVIFGASSSLGRIGVSCFEDTRVEEVVIPDGVRELGDYCFKGCMMLRCVQFGPSSSLGRIGVACFEGSQLEDVSIPDSVRELCDACFLLNMRLRRVTFGASSSLERIGHACFAGTSHLPEIKIPDSVRELGNFCFQGCHGLRCVQFGPSSSIERIGTLCFNGCGLRTFTIPASIKSIGGGVFGESPGCRVVCIEGCGFCAFGRLILSDDCQRCYSPSGILPHVSIPDSVRERCDFCFQSCQSLRRVTFGPSSSLERIGVSCFEDTKVNSQLSSPQM